MTEIAERIWKAFCEELTQESTDDMREALATAIREVANEFQYQSFHYTEEYYQLDARDIFDVADELEVK